MAQAVAVVNFTAPTSTGNTDVTHSALTGLTGRAAVLIMQHRVTAAGSLGTDRSYSIGLFDGTNQRAMSICDEDNSSAEDHDLSKSTTNAFFSVNEAQSTQFAGSVSGISGGIRINVGTAAAAAYLCTAIIFADDDVSIEADLRTLSGTGSVSNDSVNIGFQPHIIFGALEGVNTGGTSSMSFGVGMLDDYSGKYASFGRGSSYTEAFSNTWYNPTGQSDPADSTTEIRMGLQTDFTPSNYVSFDFDSVGYNWSESSFGESNEYYILAVRMDGQVCYGGGSRLTSAANNTSETIQLASIPDDEDPALILTQTSQEPSGNASTFDNDMNSVGFWADGSDSFLHACYLDYAPFSTTSATGTWIENSADEIWACDDASGLSFEAQLDQTTPFQAGSGGLRRMNINISNTDSSDSYLDTIWVRFAASLPTIVSLVPNPVWIM